MDLTERDDRCDFDSELNLEGDAMNAALAEQFRETIDIVLAAAEKAAAAMDKAGMIDRWVPGYPTPTGFQPGLRLTREQVLQHIRADVRGAFVAWLEDGVKFEVEE